MRNKFNLQNRVQIVLFLVPGLFFVAVFIYALVIWNGYVSLTDWEGLTDQINFIGLKNFKDLFFDSTFMTSVGNTFVLAVLFLVASLSIGLFAAILLDSNVHGRNAFRTIFLLPLAVSFVVSATVWSWMFAPNNGIINTILHMMHLGNLAQQWTASPHQSLICVVIVYIWQFSGFATLVFYSGISSIPEELSEAAVMEGATELQRYTRIIVPLLKPSYLTIQTILIVYAWRVFDLVYLMTGGGPGISSEVMSTYLYRVTFNMNQFGYGGSIGFFMFFVSILIIVPSFVATMRSQNEN